jgi:hypothetical protein
MLKIFIKTTNERLERDKNEILEFSIDEPQTLVETNFNQGLETLRDDYKSYSSVQNQNSVETNIDEEKGDEFIFVGEDEKEKILKIDLASSFDSLVGSIYWLCMRNQVTKITWRMHANLNQLTPKHSPRHQILNLSHFHPLSTMNSLVSMKLIQFLWMLL